jgi:hypothetical protein
MYATLANGFKDTDNDATTVTVTQTAATATMVRTMGGTYNGTRAPSKVATTINQLFANQTTLLQQMAEMLLHVPMLIPPMWALAPLGILCRLLLFVGGSYNQVVCPW